MADDHEWIRLILVDIVRQTLPHATIIETVDGAKALAEYQAGGADFLISNHCMPHLDGPSLIGEVRRHEPDLPILMVSVNPQAEKDALAAGANWFLRKEQIVEHLPPLLLRSRTKSG